MKREKKQGLIVQIYILVLAAVAVIGVVTYISQYQISQKKISAQTSDMAASASGEVISSVKEFPAYRWLINYWISHADELEIEYDAGFVHGTATEEKCALFGRRHPDLMLRYCDDEDIETLPEEDRKLYAEIVYSWLITRINAIKKTFGCDYLYCMVTDTDEGPHPYETQFFLMSAGDPGTVRGTEYEEVYTLGVTVSVGDMKNIQEAMRHAVERARAEGENGSIKSSGEKLKESGNYIDYYTCLELMDGQAVLAGSTFNVEKLLSRLHTLVLRDTFTSMLFQFLLVNLVIGHILVYAIHPLKRILEIIRSYTEQKDSKAAERSLDGILNAKRSVEIRRNEIGQLAEDFIDLTKEIDEYTGQIEKAAVEKERLAFELETAAQIQQQMLPDANPVFPDHPEFELCASMAPARSVGGDFYDYFMTDEHHLALVMADVSDKGIPAALFMAEAKALIKSRAQTGEEPAVIMTHVNNQLTETSEGRCFVTVWLAIIDLETGEGVAANAGHEHPALCRKDSVFELVIYRHDLVAGMVKDISYRQHSFRLKPGDRLYVYTDGVPEAANESGEQFGTDRMLEVLNRNRDAATGRLLEAVSEEINDFMGKAPRFDDTTMMCLHYKGNV